MPDVPHQHLDNARMAGVIPLDILSLLDTDILRMPQLKNIFDRLIRQVGATNIDWLEVLRVVAATRAEGWMAVLGALLADLGSILKNPEAHVVAAAEGLVALRHEPHEVQEPFA